MGVNEVEYGHVIRGRCAGGKPSLQPLSVCPFLLRTLRLGA